MPPNPFANGTHANGTLSWVPVLGRWDISATNQKFLGESPKAATQSQQFPLGLAVSSVSMQTGHCRVQIRFSGAFEEQEQAGGIVLGYRSPEQAYIFAELGAASGAYSVGEYMSGIGWRGLTSTGQRQNLQPNLDYLLEVQLSGQELKVLVDGVPILQHLLSRPLEGRQVGLIATGNQEISFSNFDYEGSSPKAFVVMQFAEPYDTFYKEVIQKQAEAAGYEVFRIDEKAGPGVIFQDIQREIEQAEVVIAEITPPNPNVFYEVGYAHALGKPTILLAQRGAQLPFDIRSAKGVVARRQTPQELVDPSGGALDTMPVLREFLKSFRVVFYNDTIGGKAEVERNLSKHLEAITGR